MATRSSQTCLDVGDLVDLLDLLKICGFPETNWYELGLRLGLLKSTLDIIEKNHSHDVYRCMTECISQWLGRADNVDSRGGVSLNSLSDALRSMNETDVAEKLKHHALINIFNNRHTLLSQSLCDSVAIAWLLYNERMLTQEAVSRVVSASPSIPNQREALLTGVKEAVQTDPNSLHTFANVLCTVSTNVSLGQAILDDISKYFPTPEVGVVPETIKDHEVVPQGSSTDSSTDTGNIPFDSPQVKVRVPVSKDILENFRSIRMSYGKMFYNVGKIIKQKSPLKEIKELLSCCSTTLSEKVKKCRDISSVLRLIQDECSLTNIELLHSVVDELNITEAEEHIKTYRAELKEFCKSLSISLCLKERFASISHLQCQTATFVFDWEPEEHLLVDIEEILAKVSGKLLTIEYIETSGSESVNIEKHKIEETSRKVSMGALNKWLKEGSVDLTVTRVNMLGAPGSGKTCAQLLLLGEEPPTKEVTDSTSIASPTVRAIRVAVNDENKKWKRVDRDELLERLATDLHVHEASQKKQEEIVTGSNSVTEAVLPVVTGHTPTLPPSASNEKPVHVPQHASPKPTEDEVDFHAEEVIQKILAKKPKGINLKDQNWLYVIDSGGQPAYQELLPLFTRAASLNIITLDLSKPFDKKFDMMYRIDGRYFPCCSKSTQLASFQSTVSTAANFKSLDIPTVTKQHGHSMHLVLGTHYDEVDEATLNIREDTLRTSMSSLQPYLCNRIICNNKNSEDSIIFPVNTIGKSEERVKCSRQICQAIWACGSDASLTIKIPIPWFAFELSFPKERRIVSFKEALSIGERYGMKEEDTKQALQYFHDVSLMLYYPEVTDVVFVDPKPILNILSQLLALTYVNDNSALNSILLHNDRLSQTVINHLKDGFFDEEIFTHLKSNTEIFSQPEFQLPHLISLLLHLNIITEVTDNIKGDYFIPYALSSYQGSPGIPTVSDVRPLLIVWRSDHENCEILPVPQGLFPLAMMHLLNQKDFKTKLPSSHRPDYYFKFRDAMSIKITFDQIPHTLHLINRYTHIEVSFNGPQEYCPIICKLVMKTICKVTNDLHLKHNYINAFNCLQDQEKKCYCIVNKNAMEEKQLIVNCTDCPKSYPIKGNDYWCWFKGSTDGLDSQVTCSAGPIAYPVKVSVPSITRKRRHSEDCESIEIQLPIKKQVRTVATEVLSKNIALLRSNVNLIYFADKMMERKIIKSDDSRTIVSDTMTGLSKDQRMDRLLDELKTAIAFDGSLFLWLVEILNDYDTVTSRGVADKLMKDYNELMCCDRASSLHM